MPTFDENEILAALPGTRPEIATKLGMARTTIARRLDGMRQRDLVHIGSWREYENGGSFTAVYVAGFGHDAVCVHTKKARVRKPKPLMSVIHATEDWPTQPTKIVVRRDPLIVALFGDGPALPPVDYDQFFEEPSYEANSRA